MRLVGCGLARAAEFAQSKFDSQIVGGAKVSDPRADVDIRPYGLCVFSRGVEVTASPLPFYRFATFPLQGLSSDFYIKLFGNENLFYDTDVHSVIILCGVGIHNRGV